MRNKNYKKRQFFLALTAILIFAVSIAAQTTAFNYQGKLNDGAIRQDSFHSLFLQRLVWNWPEPAGPTAIITVNSTSNAAAPASPAALFIVNLTADSADFSLSDDICDVDSGTPGEQCTLRAAIQQANVTPGTDMISFIIPGSGVHTQAVLTKSGSPPWLRRGGRASRTGWFVLKKLLIPYSDLFQISQTNHPVCPKRQPPLLTRRGVAEKNSPSWLRRGGRAISANLRS